MQIKKPQQKVYQEKEIIRPCSPHNNFLVTVKLSGKIVLYYWRASKGHNL